ncbi:hypothetical protein KIPB_009250 [Kipferlia bialata]|uniref:Uncharacterized protein n=1 Tax=Kipferlia bialata TaxID=797122 RepID=A0A9K3D1H1_9EUKA|nr:hypothetical protein KIPB_009250 [Kipferlia bialata]|eukprot:g9250.t1
MDLVGEGEVSIEEETALTRARESGSDTPPETSVRQAMGAGLKAIALRLEAAIKTMATAEARVEQGIMAYKQAQKDLLCIAREGEPRSVQDPVQALEASLAMLNAEADAVLRHTERREFVVLRLRGAVSAFTTYARLHSKGVPKDRHAQDRERCIQMLDSAEMSIPSLCSLLASHLGVNANLKHTPSDLVGLFNMALFPVPDVDSEEAQRRHHKKREKSSSKERGGERRERKGRPPLPQ